MKIKCMLIVGTRPEVIKLAPIALSMRQSPDFECVIVATGQHRELSQQALAIFGLQADINLDLMADNQAIGEFFGRAIAGLDRVIVDHQPDWILVQGDTGTVLAGAIAAYYHKIPVAHVEAGLRTYNLLAPHPEEGNRQMVSRIASLHFAPTEPARQRLLSEAIDDNKIIVTGNTVVDAVQWINKQRPKAPNELEIVLQKESTSRLVLTTIHRRESFGAPLIGMLEAIRALSEDETLNLVFALPMHPNPHISKTVRSILGTAKNVRLLPALDYQNVLALMAQSWLVLTDSGGLQEEAPCFSVPVLVLRDCTERPEGITAGVAKLIGTDKEKITAAVKRLAENAPEYEIMCKGKNPYGNGDAARLVLESLREKSRAPHA